MTIHTAVIDFNEDNTPHRARVTYVGVTDLPESFSFDGNAVTINDPDDNPLVTVVIDPAVIE